MQTQFPAEHSTRPARGQVGRPRSTQAHQAVLEAALTILKDEGYRAVTIERIAARARVGKQTIYRWWPSKAAVVLEAFRQETEGRISVPNSGALQDDLRLFLERTFRTLKRSSPIVRSLMAEAQVDPEFAAVFRDSFIRERRRVLRSLLERAIRRGELPEETDCEFLIDCLYGPMWYRLLNRHAPLDKVFAAQLVQVVVRV